MFKFNFNQPRDTLDVIENAADLHFPTTEPNIPRGKQIFISDRHMKRAVQRDETAIANEELMNSGFRLVDLTDVQRLVSEMKEEYKDLSSALEHNSDLIAGVYEGDCSMWLIW